MAQFYDLLVSDVKKETADTVSVAFDIPADLKETFRYKQGQYLTLRMMINGEDVRRSYSLCSSPSADHEWRIAVKKVENGLMSTAINDNLKSGNRVDVMAPMGNFYTELDANNELHYVSFAAGSGITPVISIIKTALDQEPKSRCTLFYGNRNNESIIFKEELNSLKSRYDGRLNVVHVLSREAQDDPLCQGRIDKEKIGGLLEKHVDMTDPGHYFLCGPEEMIRTASSILENLRVDKSNIHFELFTTPVAAAEAASNEAPSDGAAVDSEVTVIIDGDEYNFTLNTEGDSVLDAALDAGADAPYACMGAVCCTCKAKVVEGKVKMDMNYALEDSEVEEGFVLTCQSHPLTPKVVLDYDSN